MTYKIDFTAVVEKEEAWRWRRKHIHSRYPISSLDVPVGPDGEPRFESQEQWGDGWGGFGD